MTFSCKRLVETYEIDRLVPKGNAELRLTARIEIMEHSNVVYSCNVWFLESYRLLPAINAIQDQISMEDMYCEKGMYALEDSLDFDSYMDSSVDRLEHKIMSVLDSLFFQAES